MEKIMWKYLDGAYPGIYFKMTKFGKCLSDASDENYVITTKKLYLRLMDIFTCDEETARGTVVKWLESRPVYENILNSTNPHVLIAKFDRHLRTNRTV
jgi:hypothetical protein